MLRSAFVNQSHAFRLSWPRVFTDRSAITCRFYCEAVQLQEEYYRDIRHQKNIKRDIITLRAWQDRRRHDLCRRVPHEGVRAAAHWLGCADSDPQVPSVSLVGDCCLLKSIDDLAHRQSHRQCCRTQLTTAECV